jgi:hypothetical protein
MPAALAVDWDEIRECAVAGVPFIDLAARWRMLKPDGAQARCSAAMALRMSAKRVPMSPTAMRITTNRASVMRERKKRTGRGYEIRVCLAMLRFLPWPFGGPPRCCA